MFYITLRNHFSSVFVLYNFEKKKKMKRNLPFFRSRKMANILTGSVHFISAGYTDKQPLLIWLVYFSGVLFSFLWIILLTKVEKIDQQKHGNNITKTSLVRKKMESIYVYHKHAWLNMFSFLYDQGIHNIIFFLLVKVSNFFLCIFICWLHLCFGIWPGNYTYYIHIIVLLLHLCMVICI